MLGFCDAVLRRNDGMGRIGVEGELSWSPTPSPTELPGVRERWWEKLWFRTAPVPGRTNYIISQGSWNNLNTQ